MPRRIQIDHQMFRRVVSGTTRKELQKYIKNGGIITKRGTDTVRIPIPQIDLPHFVFGRPKKGVDGGPGDQGDVVGHEDPKNGNGNNAGTDPGDAIEVDVDVKEILKLMAEDWNLPNMKPKESATFEEIRIRYNSLSKIGPPALLHKRKTMLQTIKRMSAAGELDPSKARILPGSEVPIVPLTPIKDDMRYRQWNEIKIPCSKAVIFFLRDISGSMDNYRCEIVSDMCWWIDKWIQQYYDHTERVYAVHDSRAHEVSERQFYRIRQGGGTMCSTAFEWVAKQLKHRFPPLKWNVYIFYFSDGENWGDDNAKLVKCLRQKLGPDVVNLIGLTQILSYGNHTLKEYIDERIANKKLDNKYIRTAGIARPENQQNGWGWWYYSELDPEVRNAAIKNAIQELLGTHNQAAGDSKKSVA